MGKNWILEGSNNSCEALPVSPVSSAPQVGGVLRDGLSLITHIPNLFFESESEQYAARKFTCSPRKIDAPKGAWIIFLSHPCFTGYETDQGFTKRTSGSPTARTKELGTGFCWSFCCFFSLEFCMCSNVALWWRKIDGRKLGIEVVIMTWNWRLLGCKAASYSQLRPSPFIGRMAWQFKSMIFLKRIINFTSTLTTCWYMLIHSDKLTSFMLGQKLCEKS